MKIDVLPFLDALTDSSQYIRARSAEILGKLRNPDAIPGLVDAMYDPANTEKFTSGLFYQRSVQNIAGDALVSIGGEAAIAALEAMLNDQDKGWRVMAIVLLKMIAMKKQNADDKMRVIVILQTQLKDPDLEIRTHTIEALREIVFEG